MTYEDVKQIRNNPTLADVDNEELAKLIDKAIEKQIPKKPKEEWDKPLFSDDNGCLFQHLMCSNCGKMEVNKIDYFCPYCGQKIDWE